MEMIYFKHITFTFIPPLLTTNQYCSTVRNLHLDMSEITVRQYSFKLVTDVSAYVPSDKQNVTL